jgi:ribosomal protein S10
MPDLLRFSVLLLLILNSANSTNSEDAQQSIRPPAGDSAGSQSPSLSILGVPAATDSATCPSRTANYITHPLPQQCLRTNRASTTTTNLTNRTATVEVQAPTSSLDSSISGKDKESQVSSTRATLTASHEQQLNLSTASATKSDQPDISSSTTVTAQEPEETDSPLDNANFLSFEDWKRQNLVKSGQSPENLDTRSHSSNGDRKRPGINNALDTLGEEGEIELDFSGFGASHDKPSHESASAGSSDPSNAHSSLSSQTARSKDAGKTCKERTNYASFDCSASIMKSNQESKSGSSILVENKDSYMLSKCSAKNKFVIVELCSDILVDTIVLANYEFFSSIFRHFRISVSDRYPVKMEKWKDLGTFEARNTREVQAFLIENPLIWARYLRIEFLTHYGNEYYCPVSLLRVHGTTMMDEFRHQEEIARGELPDDDVVVEADVPAQTTVPPVPRAETNDVEKSIVQTVSSTVAEVTEPTPEPRRSSVATSSGTFDEGMNESATNSDEFQHFYPLRIAYPTCATDDESSTATASIHSNSPSKPAEGSPTSTQHASSATTEPVKGSQNSEKSEALNSSSAIQQDTTRSSMSAANEKDKVADATSASSQPASSDTINTTATSQKNETSTTSPPKSVAPVTNSTRPPTSGTNAPPAQPSTQESFFKSVHKRLQQLESNSTLSLQYIEEQSRILRDAFSKVEKRQVASTTKFLSQLNSTVMGELQGFRQAYDQLWQSTVIELEGQRDQYQREMLALSTRLTLVADELVWQKRMGIVQSTLLLLCLALVLFNRNGNSALVEMPLLQQMMNKSQAALRSGWESPTGFRSQDDHSPDNRSPVSLFRKRYWQRRSTEPTSGHATDFTDSRPQSRDASHGMGPDVTLDPPTPPSADDTESGEEEGEWKEVPEVQSGPATPTGTREALGSPTWEGDELRPSISMG